MSSNLRLARFLALLLLIALPAIPAALAKEPEPESEVRAAIDRAVAWLKKRQQRDGSWGRVRGTRAYGGGGQGAAYDSPAGPTALALFALLSAGELSKAPVIKKGFSYLGKYERPGTSMETSMLLLAITATTKPKPIEKKKKPRLRRIGVLPNRLAGWARKVTKHLIGLRTAQGWRYNLKNTEAPGGAQDLFSTNLATWALVAAHRVRVKEKIPDKVWDDVLRFTLAQQEQDGPAVTYEDAKAPDERRKAHARGFAYIQKDEPTEPDSRSTGGNTACGIANIALVRWMSSEWGHNEARWTTREDAKQAEAAVYDGLAWLVKHWHPSRDPNHAPGRVSHMCWLWNLQCAMDALELERLDKLPWFETVVSVLLNQQFKEGYWKTEGTWAPQDVLDTCFAILVLTRATRGLVQNR